jgi:hypothetical protein
LKGDAVVESNSGLVGSDRVLTASQLFAYLQREVYETAAKFGSVQTPQFGKLLLRHGEKSCDGDVLFLF